MKYRGEIDGLRALAVVPVILFHAGFPAFSGGFVGVDVFFVISGYLISTIILNELDEGRFSLLRFYERRARRILPALFTVMLVSIPFAWFWLMPRDLKDFADSLVAVLFFASNFLFWLETDYFATAAELKPLLHTWSLAVEEQYYIIFPVLMMMLNPFGKNIILKVLLALFVVSFALSHWGIYNSPVATFFLLPARGWELLLGVFAATYLRKDPEFNKDLKSELLAFAGLVLILAPVFLYDAKTPFPGAYALPPTLGTALIILFARRGTLTNRLLATKPLVAIGLVSYSAYLWHQPVFAFFKHRFGSTAFDQNAFLLIALSIVLATLSYWIVERPFRRTASLRTLTLSMASCCVMLIGAITAFLTVTHDNPDSVPSFKWAIANASPELIAYIEGRDTKKICDMRDDDIGLEFCPFGDPDQEPSMVLWGDSLAGALLHGIDQVALENGFSGMAFVSNGCPPVLGLRNSAMTTCTDKTHARVFDQIAELSTIETIIITGNLSIAMSAGNVSIDGSPTSKALVRERIAQALERFTEKGIRTVLLEQGPIYGEAVSRYELQRLRNDHIAPLSLTRDEQIESVLPTRDLADIFDTYIETTDFFCDDALCPSIDADGRMVIYDRNHVTKEYSVRLARLALDRLRLAE